MPDLHPVKALVGPRRDAASVVPPGSYGGNDGGACVYETRLTDLPGVPLAELSVDGQFIDVNGALCRLLGRTPAEILGHSPAEFSHPDDQEGSRNAIRSVVDSFRGDPFEKRYLRPDGTIVWARVTPTWVADRNRILGHVQDITDLVDAREQASAATNRVAALVKHSANLIFVVNADGRITDANPATDRLLGNRIGQLARDVLMQSAHPDDVAGVLDTLGTSLRAPGSHEPITFRIRCSDGTWRYLEAVGNNQLSDPAIRGVVLNARDVTERVTHAQQTEDNLKGLIATLGRASEYRDPYTSGHQHRVARIAAAVATAMGLDAHCVEGVRLGAEVHDIGKIAIPIEILAYPGKLTPLTFNLIKTHCQIGHDIVADIAFPWPIATIILQHHERLDGSGYPNALHADDILIESQIVAVADIVEAITSHRPYRPAHDTAHALGALRLGRATKYNADAVDACIGILLDKVIDDCIGQPATA
jgi:PAS domain S-box-containing protein